MSTRKRHREDRNGACAALPETVAWAPGVLAACPPTHTRGFPAGRCIAFPAACSSCLTVSTGPSTIVVMSEHSLIFRALSLRWRPARPKARGGLSGADAPWTLGVLRAARRCFSAGSPRSRPLRKRGCLGLGPRDRLGPRPGSGAAPPRRVETRAPPPPRPLGGRAPGRGRLRRALGDPAFPGNGPWAVASPRLGNLQVPVPAWCHCPRLGCVRSHGKSPVILDAAKPA